MEKKSNTIFVRFNKSGIMSGTTYNDKYNPIFMMIVKNKLSYEVCKLLLNHHSYINDENNKLKLLELAARYSSKELFQSIFDILNIDIKTDKYNMSYLISAIQYSNEEIVELLIHNINIDKINSKGYSILLYAIKNSSIDIIKMILKIPNINVDVSEYDKLYNLSKFNKQVYRDHFNKLCNDNPLILAIKNNLPISIVELLLDNPTINVNYQNRYFDSALSIILNDEFDNYNYIDIFNLLINHPNINLSNHKKILLTAIRKKLPNNIIKSLIKNPIIDVNYKDNSGHSALSLSIVNHLYIALNLLLKHPKIVVNNIINVNYKNETSLLLAIKENISCETIKTILKEHNIKLEYINKNKENVLLT
jgi:ankyrin repeat protein